MDRRTFVGLTAATGATFAQTAPKAKNVVLVHGLFADGSSWSEVIPRLQAAGLNVTSVQNPLSTLPEAVEAAVRALDRQNGPTVLAGHSFSGMIVTDAGVHRNVSALVYVAARAPDAAEDYAALAKQFPAPPASAGIVFDGDEGQLSEEAFLRDFAGDLPEAKARALFAVQWPFSEGTPHRQNQQRSMAVKAELVCRIYGGSDHQSCLERIHGKANGHQNERGQGEPRFADTAACNDCEPNSGSGWRVTNEPRFNSQQIAKIRRA